MMELVKNERQGQGRTGKEEMKRRNSKRKKETKLSVQVRSKQGRKKTRKKMKEKRKEKKEETLEELISMHRCDAETMNGVKERRQSNEARMFL